MASDSYHQLFPCDGFCRGVKESTKHEEQGLQFLAQKCKCILLNLCSKTIHGALSSFLSLLKEKNNNPKNISQGLFEIRLQVTQGGKEISKTTPTLSPRVSRRLLIALHQPGKSYCCSPRLPVSLEAAGMKKMKSSLQDASRDAST